jgi:hypothetical protein
MAQNDQFFMSHKHYFEDGLPNLEEQQENARVLEDDQSTSSVIRTPPFGSAKVKPQAALFSAEVRACFLSESPHLHLQDLTTFISRMSNVKISSEVRAYLHNIVVFMRLHRAVAGGISALATRHFNTLA